jgi:hypothetical protein
VKIGNLMSDTRIAWTWAFAIVAFVLVAGGWNDVPMNDDFSYGLATEALARTGHITYNGWGTPLMLPQMAVGALLVRVFGFSWWTLHLVGFVSAGAYGALVWLLARACGVGRSPSAWITATLIASPFVLGSVPTFLTDLPGAALGLWSLLWLVESLRDGGPVDRRRLVAAIAIGLVAGMNRQSLWLPFLGSLGIVAWLVPSSRKMVLPGGVLILATAVPLVRWFDSFDYTVPVRFDMGMQLILAFPPVAFRAIYKFLNLVGLFVLPFAWPALRGLKVRWLLLGALGFVAILPPLHPMGTKGMPLLSDKYMLTYYGQYFTSAGALVGGVDGFTRKPAAMAPIVVGFLVFAGAAGVAVGGYLFFDWWERALSRGTQSRSRIEVAKGILLAYVAVQVIAFLPWLAQMNMFDRYLIPLLPCLLIFHALQAQRGGTRQWWPAAAFAVAYGLFGMASAWDYFGHTRARQDLRARLLADGVSANQIDGGFEFNAETQVRIGHHMNNPAIARPAGAYDPDATGNYLAYLPEMFPVMDARWRISTNPGFGLVEEPPVHVRRWWSPLPPFSHTMGAYKILRAD